MILRKIIKIVAVRFHILRPKCTKFDFGWGSASDPAGGPHSSPPAPATGFQGVLLLREGKGEEEEYEERGEEGVVRKGGVRLRHGFWGMDAPEAYGSRPVVLR